MPQIENLTMADYEESPYGSGSQILSFDEENMSVTLVSHRECPKVLSSQHTYVLKFIYD